MLAHGPTRTWKARAGPGQPSGFFIDLICDFYWFLKNLNKCKCLAKLAAISNFIESSDVNRPTASLARLENLKIFKINQLLTHFKYLRDIFEIYKGLSNDFRYFSHLRGFWSPFWTIYNVFETFDPLPTFDPYLIFWAFLLIFGIFY